ncbi:hypothetical protein Pelo_386 [Pelomyxa schiedti]|nr:hypothetical protein Pelo_386 [Pelomyxa schiedti]
MSFRVTGCVSARDQFVALAVVLASSSSSRRSSATSSAPAIETATTTPATLCSTAENVGGSSGGGGGGCVALNERVLVPSASAAARMLPWSVMARIGREWVTATARRVALKMLCDDSTVSQYHMVWVVVGVSHTLGVTEGPRAVDYLGMFSLVCGFMAHGRSALVCRTGFCPGLDVMVTDAAADSCGAGGVGGGRGAKGEVGVTGVELGVKFPEIPCREGDKLRMKFTVTQRGGVIGNGNELCVLRGLQYDCWSIEVVDLEKTYNSGKMVVVWSTSIQLPYSAGDFHFYIMSPNQGGLFVLFYTTGDKAVLVDVMSGSMSEFSSFCVQPVSDSYILVFKTARHAQVFHVADAQQQRNPVKDWLITDTTMQLGSRLGMVFTSTAESFSYRNTVKFYDAPTGFFMFSLYSRSCGTRPTVFLEVDSDHH